MKAVVVGGCGFLGVPIVNGLAEAGFEVVSLHRAPGHVQLDERITCVSSDYRDIPSIRPYLSHADCLIHLGSQSVPRTSVALGVAGILQEVDANALLFACAADEHVESIVFASSGGSVYGDCPPGQPITEQHATMPISPHGLLKIMTELALAHVAGVSGQRAVSLRPGNVYGPGQRSQVGFGVIPTFLSNLMAGRGSEIWGPEVVRDYVYVEDAARAFITAATARSPLPQAMNIGTGVGHTAVEIYGLLQALLGVSEPVTVQPRPRADPPWVVLDTALSRSMLGDYAQVPIEIGLKATADWYRGQGL